MAASCAGAVAVGVDGAVGGAVSNVGTAGALEAGIVLCGGTVLAMAIAGAASGRLAAAFADVGAGAGVPLLVARAGADADGPALSSTGGLGGTLALAVAMTFVLFVFVTKLRTGAPVATDGVVRVVVSVAVFSVFVVGAAGAGALANSVLPGSAGVVGGGVLLFVLVMICITLRLGGSAASAGVPGGPFDKLRAGPRRGGDVAIFAEARDEVAVMVALV
jgi:hypothetical protein